MNALSEFLQNTGLLADIAIGLIVLMYALIKARKGLYRAFMPIVALVLAICVGIVCANIFSDRVFEMIKPSVEESVANSIENLGGGVAEGVEILPVWLNSILDSFSLKGEADELIAGKGAQALESVKHKVFEVTAKATGKAIHLITFVLGTLAAWIVLILFFRMLGGLTELPLIKQVDAAGGFLLGLLQCFVVLYIIVKICDMRGVMLFHDLADKGSVILQKILSL